MRVLFRAKSGKGMAIAYDESREERAARIERSGNEAFRHLRMTEGQYRTLARAQARARTRLAS